MIKDNKIFGFYQLKLDPRTHSVPSCTKPDFNCEVIIYAKLIDCPFNHRLINLSQTMYENILMIKTTFLKITIKHMQNTACSMTMTILMNKTGMIYWCFACPWYGSDKEMLCWPLLGSYWHLLRHKYRPIEHVALVVATGSAIPLLYL